MLITLLKQCIGGSPTLIILNSKKGVQFHMVLYLFKIKTSLLFI